MGVLGGGRGVEVRSFRVERKAIDLRVYDHVSEG